MTDEELVRLRGQTGEKACPCPVPEDFPTGLYQALGDRILHLMPDTRADLVAMGSGTVEDRIVNLERRLGSGEGFHIGEHVAPDGGLAVNAEEKLALSDDVAAAIAEGQQGAIKADRALETAGNALATANAANARAESAAANANAASETADAANRAAGQSLATAQAGLETAENAGKTAAAADAKADDAVAIANAANSRADDAVTTANAAAKTAASAESEAKAATTAAAAASDTAGNALSKAASASETAGNALSAASSASTTAGNALATANAAKALCVDMKGATASAAGVHGFVPAPTAGAANRFLRSDGTWQVPPGTNTIYGAATQTASGLMSAADKKKLDGIASGATATAAPPAAATAAPKAHGTATVGTSAKYAREDHVHPSNNTDTHWTSHLYAGTGAAANAATANGATKLAICDNSTVRNTVTIKGAGAASVASDAAGNITITGTNTTYGAATQSANGLMTAADKKKLDGYDDGNYLHRLMTDVEWVEGYKVFIKGLGLCKEGYLECAYPSFIYRDSNQDGVANAWTVPIQIRDKNQKELAQMRYVHENGTRQVALALVNPHNNQTPTLGLHVGSDGTQTAFCPTAPAGWGGDWIATLGWVRTCLASTASVASLSTAAELPQSRRVSVSAATAATMALNDAAGISALSSDSLADFELCDTFLTPADADINATGQPQHFEIPLTEDELFTRLRSERNRRLLVIDSQIAMLNRRLRRAGSMEEQRELSAQIDAWDDYAQALCALPDQDGAPWDGGGKETPWPTPPGAGAGAEE